MYKEKIFLVLNDFGKNFILFFVLFLYFLLACLFSDKIYLIIIKDLLNIIVLFTMMFIIKAIVSDKNGCKYLYNSFLFLSIVFALIISIQRIYHFFYIESYADLYDSQYIHTNIAIIDNNFAIVPVFFGMVGILYLFLEGISRSKLLILNILLFVFSIDVLLSGSKRGIILFVIIFILIFTIHLVGLFKTKFRLKEFCKNSKYYLLLFSFSILLLIFMFFNTSVYFKNNVLRGIGVKNISFTKIQISETLFRYIHFLDKNINDAFIYSKIWQPVFDPKDPEAGGGNGNYKIINVLPGKNSEIVPTGSKGYLLDNTCLGFASFHHSYYFLPVKQETVNKGDSVVASVYCYVSEDFDGDGAALRIEGSLTGSPDSFYDLNKKGYWQKLVLPLSCLNGNIKIYLYINKAKVPNFSTLKGYVIFAYPESRIISNFKTSANPLIQNSNRKRTTITNDEFIDSKLHLNLTSDKLKKVNKAYCSNASMLFFFSQIKPFRDPDPDPIRNWLAKLVSEDTVYHGYKANLEFERAKDNFGEDRTTRWKFAIEIFKKEYTWPQKLFGGGFAFLNWYGYCFLGDKTKSDYPHNPFLFILLYSGMIGLSIYLLLIYKVFYYYLKYIKEYPVYFIFFIIAFYFTFFSGGNPFDPPIMGFLLILPFFIHFVHNRDKKHSLNTPIGNNGMMHQGMI